jgi:ribosomal protein L7/L12
MSEQLIIEFIIALVISIIIVKITSRQKTSDRGLLRPIEQRKRVDDEQLRKIVLPLVQTGQKIQAIKIVRQLTSLGLKEAKDIVEALESGNSSPLSVKKDTGFNFPPSVQQEILTLIRAGNKIEAIKLVRKNSGAGLKEAKDFVESLG